MAELVRFFSEINVTWETEMGARFILVDNNDEIIWLDSALDPFSTNGGWLHIIESINITQALIGDENYDAGLTFGCAGVCGYRRPSKQDCRTPPPCQCAFSQGLDAPSSFLPLLKRKIQEMVTSSDQSDDTAQKKAMAG